MTVLVFLANDVDSLSVSIDGRIKKEIDHVWSLLEAWKVCVLSVSAVCIDTLDFAEGQHKARHPCGHRGQAAVYGDTSGASRWSRGAEQHRAR